MHRAAGDPPLLHNSIAAALLVYLTGVMTSPPYTLRPRRGFIMYICVVCLKCVYINILGLGSLTSSAAQLSLYLSCKGGVTAHHQS